MKKIQMMILVLATFFVASCSLDEHPYSITSEQLAQSEKGVEQLVTGIYAIFWDNWCMEQTYEAWIHRVGCLVLPVAETLQGTMPTIPIMICGVCSTE